MHVFTLVITPGPRRSAVMRAERLLDRAVPPSYDYWSIGGRFESRLRSPSPDPRFDEIADLHEAARLEERRRAWGWEIRDGDSSMEELVMQAIFEDPPELPPLPLRSIDHLTALTSHLPNPLSPRMVPAALVTPGGQWAMRPVSMSQGDESWRTHVSAVIDRYRPRHCVVVADCHC